MTTRVNIDGLFYFNIDLSYDGYDKYVDLNTLEVHSGDVTIKFKDDQTMQYMFQHVYADFATEFEQHHSDVEVNNDTHKVHIDVLIYLLIRRFPSFIYKLIHLLSKVIF